MKITSLIVLLAAFSGAKVAQAQEGTSDTNSGILSFAHKLGTAISKGEDSEAKTQINAATSQAEDAVKKSNEQQKAFQAGIDAYEAAKLGAPARAPSSDETPKE